MLGISWTCNSLVGLLVFVSALLVSAKMNQIINSPLTMDTSAREAMKDAAKCDKHCDLQISANQQISERIMRDGSLLLSQACVSVFWIIPLDCWKQH